MKEKENVMTLYLYEKNLLKTLTTKLLESSNEIVHDNVLSIFDNIDELNRMLHKYLINNQLITKEIVSSKKKELLYEQLDTLLLRINE